LLKFENLHRKLFYLSSRMWDL